MHKIEEIRKEWEERGDIGPMRIGWLIEQVESREPYQLVGSVYKNKLAIARDALLTVKAAIGDRLLAKGPLSTPYAHGVFGEIDEALEMIDGSR